MSWEAHQIQMFENLRDLPLTTVKEDVAIRTRPYRTRDLKHANPTGVVPGAVIRAETSYHLIMSHNPLIPWLLEILKLESVWPQCLIFSFCTEG